MAEMYVDKYVDKYVQGIQILQQQPHSRLGPIIPRGVVCSGCYARPGHNSPCPDCERTRRCQIPWAEVMNVQ